MRKQQHLKGASLSAASLRQLGSVDGVDARVSDMQLAVLFVGDSIDDVVLMLRKYGYEVVHRRVDSADALVAALSDGPWQVVVSDYRMPEFDGLAALRIVRELGDDVPFILVSGAIGEETAVSLMQAGAQDYLMKTHLVRLAPAVEREIREADIRHARRQAQQQLEQSEARLAEVQRLAQLGSWILDLGTNKLAWPDEVYEIFEAEPAKRELSYESFVAATHPR